MDEEKLVKKQGRIKKTEKRKLAKSSATLAGQILRVRTAREYRGKRKKSVRIKTYGHHILTPHSINSKNRDPLVFRGKNFHRSYGYDSNFFTLQNFAAHRFFLIP